MSAPLEHSPEGIGDQVAEVQGLYGPFTFPELLLQKIWWRRDFDVGSARTLDGRPVQISHPGRWNRLGGPDFRDARLRIGDDEVEGDVELHLRARDWDAHGHRDDPEYAGVKLHVVLFPGQAKFTRGAGDREIPVLALLPLLFHGLEEYAAEDATEGLANRPLDEALETLATLSERELEEVLRQHADRRWALKIHFARARLERLGWASACHHSALEILGYRFNRAPMLGVAARWPLTLWTHDDGSLADAAFRTFAEQWTLHGVRPLNHPRLRLNQYAEWTKRRPTWPDQLARAGDALASCGRSATSCEEATGALRKRLGFAAIRAQLASDACGAQVGGSRLDNMICDGFLPLLAAANEAKSADLGIVWSHWYGGDLPPSFARGLRALGVFRGAQRPVSHGPLQGLLGWMLNRRD